MGARPPDDLNVILINSEQSLMDFRILFKRTIYRDKQRRDKGRVNMTLLGKKEQIKSVWSVLKIENPRHFLIHSMKQWVHFSTFEDENKFRLNI